MVTDFRTARDAVAARGGLEAGRDPLPDVPAHLLYGALACSIRAPVSVVTVARELGHGGEAMVRNVYGHLGQVRPLCSPPLVAKTCH